MNNRTAIKLGVIGAGSITPQHIKVAVKSGFILDSICARDYSRSARILGHEFRFMNVYDTFEEFSMRKLDAYLVLTNTESQIEITQKLLEKRKPILVEKPVSTNPDLIKALDFNDKLNQVVVGYNRRNLSSIRNLRASLNKSPFSFFTVSIPELSSLQYASSEEIENTILENTVHVFDLIFFLFGKPDRWQITGIDYENRMFSRTINFYYGGIHKGTALVTIGIPENWSITVYSPGQRFVLSPIESFINYSKMESTPATSNRPNKIYTPQSITPWKPDWEDIEFKAGFYRQIKDFHEFITMGNKPDTLASLSDAHFASAFAQEILDKIKISL